MGPYCHNYKRYFQPGGIARHRAMHRDRKENCTITLSDGTWAYNSAEGAASND